MSFTSNPTLKLQGSRIAHILVPVAPIYGYNQTRTFAQIIGKMLIPGIPTR
jgi:hypothetical protein